MAPAAPRPLADRLAIWLFITYICLLPVSWSPFPWNIQWCDLVFVALLVSTVATRRRFVYCRLDILLFLYLASSMPSLVGATDIRLGVLEFTKDLYLAVAYIVVALLTMRLVRMERVARWLAYAAVAVSAICLLAVAVRLLTGVATPWLGAVMPLPYVGDFYRLYGTFQSPEYLINFLVFVTPWTITLAFRSAPAGTRFKWLVAALAILGAALFTAAHGIAGLAVASALSIPRAWRRERPLVAAVCVVAAIGVVLAVNALLIVAVRDVNVRTSRNTSVGQPPYPYAFHDAQEGAPTLRVEVTYDVMVYWLLKRVALDAWLRAPWEGAGLGAFHAETRRAVTDGRLSPDYREHDPHSTWFGRLAETGLIGTAALAALWLGMFAHARQWATSAAHARHAVALAAGLAGLLVNSLNVDVMHFRFLWLAFGLLRGLDSRV